MIRALVNQAENSNAAARIRIKIRNYILNNKKNALAGFVKAINQMSTKVKVKCVSKKESVNHSKENPVATAIELEVPYDQNSIYWKLSGGTNMTLNTVNKHAADMFVIGKEYDMIISPSVAE